MMRAASFALASFLLCAHAGYAVDDAAQALAGMMKQAKYSEGFEARLNVLVTMKNGAHPAPLRLAVVGQASADRQRLSIRALSPEAARKRAYVAERGRDGRIRMLEHAANEYTEFDPLAKMFGAGVVAWDMFSPWWDWPSQSLQGVERIKDRECEKIRSVTDDKNSVVQEVESCVDRQAKLSLRTRLYDGKHALIRTTSVERVMRKGQSGALGAKVLTITDASQARTDLEVYAGDEEYLVSEETFAGLNYQRRGGQQETK